MNFKMYLFIISNKHVYICVCICVCINTHTLKWLHCSPKQNKLSPLILSLSSGISKIDHIVYLLDPSVQFSCSVVSDSLWPHELQHARPPCLSPTPGVHPNSCPSSQWCHPAIPSSVIPFSSCPQSPQHQSFFQWVNSSHQVAKVLEFQLQY